MSRKNLTCSPAPRATHSVVIASTLLLAATVGSSVRGQDASQQAAQANQPIQPAEINLGRPVDFERDVFPILDAKCVACHNVAISENGLILEDVKSILKGGKRGPSVVPKEPDKSSLYRLAARAAQPAMPPLPNKVEAAAITPQELGIIKQWILEGATTGMGGAEKKINWQPLPKGISPIYSVAITSDGQYAACGRGNHVVIYHVPTGEQVAELTDPNLLPLQHNGKPMYDQGSSHRDFVHSLAFSPNGRMLASGGFREVKLWTRPEAGSRLDLAASTAAVPVVAVSPDDKWVATASADNSIKLWSLPAGQAGKVLAGHTAAVTGLVFSVDGAKLVSSSADQSVRVWNVADGAVVARIDAPSPLQGVALTPDGLKLVTAGADKLIRMWDMPTAAPKQLAAPAAPVPAIATSLDKKWLALAEADGKVTLVDLATGQAKALAGHAGAVNSVSFSGNSARLVSGGADKTIRVWDVATGQPVAVLSGSVVPVTAAALNAAGTQAASGAADGQTSIWKLDAVAPRALAGDNGAPATVSAISADGKQLATDGVAAGKPAIIVRDIASGAVTKTLAGHEGAITALAFSADGTKVISGSADKTARVWTLADSKEIAKFAGHTNTVTGVTFNSNAVQAITGSADNSLKSWTVADAKEVANFAGHAGPISGVAMTPNDQQIISASADQTVRLWNPAGQQTAAIAHGQPVSALALSRDGTKLAAAGADNTVKLYQLDGKLLFTLAGHTAAIKSLAFSPDHLRVVSGSADNTANVWEVATGSLLETTPVAAGLTFARFGMLPTEIVVGAADKALSVVTLKIERLAPGQTKAITGLVYSLQGDAICASSADGILRRVVVANGQQAWTQNAGAPINDLAISPDGNWLATAAENNQVRLWNAANGGASPKPITEIPAAPVRSACFSLDNLHVAFGTANNLVYVYNVQTGATEQRFAEHTAAVEALAASGETGKLFISSGVDRTIRSWPLVAGLQIAGHTGAVNAVAVVAPGTRVLSGSEDGTVRVWDLANGAQAQTMNHGGPVTSVAVRADGQAYASASANNTGKLWNAANAQQIAELRGDMRAQRQVLELTTDDNEAKAYVTLTTNAVPAAEKASMDRAEAVKKAVENKEKAEKASVEMAAKAKEAADKLAAAKTALDAKKDDAALMKAVTDAEKASTDAAAAAKAAEAEKNRAIDGVTQAEKAAKEAVENIAKAKTEAEAAVVKQKATDAALTAGKAAALEREKPVRSIAFSPDGKQLAMAGDSFTVCTFDAVTGVPFAALDGHKAPVLSVAFAAGHKLVTGGGDQTAKVWDLSPAWTLAGTLGPKKEAPLDLNDSVFVGRVLCLDFNREGTLLATGGGDPSRSGEVMLWDVATQTVAKTLPEAHSDTVFGIKFSRDSKFLLCGAADKFVKIFDVASGKHVKSFEGHTNHVLAVSWRADGKRVVSAGADNAIKVWNVEIGEQERTIAGYTKQVTAIQYMGRGNNFVSCGGDKTVRFHQGDNGNNIRSFAGATDFMFAAAASDNEAIVIAGGQDGVLRVWNGTNAQPLKTFDPPKAPDNQTAQAPAAK